MKTSLVHSTDARTPKSLGKQVDKDSGDEGRGIKSRGQRKLQHLAADEMEGNMEEKQRFCSTPTLGQTHRYNLTSIFNQIAPYIGYHHILMVLLATAVILLCECIQDTRVLGSQATC